MKVKALLLIAVLGFSQSSFAMQSSLPRTDLQVAKLVGCGIAGAFLAKKSWYLFGAARWCFNPSDSWRKLRNEYWNIAKREDLCPEVKQDMQSETNKALNIFEDLSKKPFKAFCIGSCIGALGLLSSYCSYRLFKAAINAGNALLAH